MQLDVFLPSIPYSYLQISQLFLLHSEKSMKTAFFHLAQDEIQSLSL